MGRRAWQSTFGNVRSFVGNALGGMRGWNNVASWAVAGTLAYFLWVKPAQQLRKEEEIWFCLNSLTCTVDGSIDQYGVDSLGIRCDRMMLYLLEGLLIKCCDSGDGIRSLLFYNFGN